MASNSLSSDSSAFAEPDLEDLAEEFLDRFRQGDHPSITEYVEEYPAMEAEIRELFPTIASLETFAKRNHQKLAQSTPKPIPVEYLGDYRLIEEIGRGGMGVVYRAEQLSLGRTVAVKVLPQKVMQDTKQVARFQREARTAAKLHHTNIVPVFGVGEQDGYHYYVMQHIQGVALHDVLAQLRRFASGKHADSSPLTEIANGLLDEFSTEIISEQQVVRDVQTERLINDETACAGTSGHPAHPRTGSKSHTQRSGNWTRSPGQKYWRNVARLGRDVADALAYAHSQSTLHCDIKPANLLLDPHGGIWVADFGLAKIWEAENLNGTGEIVGTVRYMAPEQFRGEADPRTDLYSLGITLYELLTLNSAHANTQERWESTRQPVDLIPPRKINPQIPRDLAAIVEKAAAIDPKKRYQSAGELEFDLNQYLQGHSVQARPVSRWVLFGKWCKRNQAVAALSGLTLLLLMAITLLASLGYLHSRKVNQNLNLALSGELRERERAEDRTEMALNALDQIFEEFSPNRLVSTEMTFDTDTGEILDVTIPPVLSPQIATLLESLMVFYDQLAEAEENDPRVVRKVAQANRRVGDIRQRLGQYEAAKEAYQRAILTYKQLKRTRVSNESNLTLELARITNELGITSAQMEQDEHAQEYHQRALGMLAELPRDVQQQAEVQFELARSHTFLSSRDSGRGETNEKRYPHLTKALSILQPLVDAFPEVPAYQLLQARCYRTLSRRQKRHYSQSIETLHQAADLLKRLVSRYPNVPDYQYELAETWATVDLWRIPYQHSLQKNLSQRLSKANGIAETLVAEHPNVTEYQVLRAQVQHKLAILHLRVGSRDEAEKLLRDTIAMQIDLTRQFPQSFSHEIWLTFARLELVKLLTAENQHAEATSLCDDILNRLLDYAPEEVAREKSLGIIRHFYRELKYRYSELNDAAFAEYVSGLSSAMDAARGRNFKKP